MSEYTASTMDVQKVLDGATFKLLDMTSETEEETEDEDETESDSVEVVYLKDLRLPPFASRIEDNQFLEGLKLLWSLMIGSYLADMLVYCGRMGPFILLVSVAVIVGGEMLLELTESTLPEDDFAFEESVLDRIFDAGRLVGTVLLLLDIVRAIEI
jgi:hypothetical protein